MNHAAMHELDRFDSHTPNDPLPHLFGVSGVKDARVSVADQPSSRSNFFRKLAFSPASVTQENPEARWRRTYYLLQ